MSLMQLLAAGKSLVGMKDGNSPYRVTRQRLLPKFGSAKNPFCPANSSEPTEASPGHEGDLSAAAPQAAAPKAADSVGSAPARKGCLGRLKERLASPFSRQSEKPSTPSLPRFNQTPVQCELSLDRVRVVRNDLSDADLEIVPVRRQVNPFAKAAASSERNGFPSGCNEKEAPGPARRDPAESRSERTFLGRWPKDMKQTLLRKVGAMRL